MKEPRHHKLTIDERAIKDLQRMPGSDARRVRDRLEKLSLEPNRQDIDVIPLRGRSGFRLRVGSWRVIFERDDDAREILVLRIGPRGDVYRR